MVLINNVKAGLTVIFLMLLIGGASYAQTIHVRYQFVYTESGESHHLRCVYTVKEIAAIAIVGSAEPLRIFGDHLVHIDRVAGAPNTPFFDEVIETNPDFTESEKSALNTTTATFLKQKGISNYQKVGEPSASQNCHGFAFDLSFWVDDIHAKNYYNYKYKQVPFKDAKAASHYTGPVDGLSLPVHSSKTSMEDAVIPEGCQGAGNAVKVNSYEGKFGFAGRYKGDQNLPVKAYNVSKEDYYKPI